jgi:hypothetical protein
MASRTQHAVAAEQALSNVKAGVEVDTAMVAVEVAKVQATLAVAAALSEIAQHLYKIGH